MRVIIFIRDFNATKKLLQYINEAVDVILINESHGITDKNLNPLPYKSVDKCISSINWDYILTSGNPMVEDLVSFGINPSKIIDVDFILNDDYMKKVFMAVGVKNSITDFETVIVGDFSTFMGINANELISKTANFSSNHQDLRLSYLWLKKVLSTPNNKIKYAIIGLSPYCLRYDLSQENNSNLLAYYSVFRDELDFPISNEVMSALFSKVFLQVYDLSNANYAANAGQYSSLNFADPFGGKKLYDRPLIQQDVYGVRSDARKWDSEKCFSAVEKNSENFIDCLKLCREHNVIPIVVKLPVHSFYKSLFPKELTAELDTMLYRAKKVVPFRLVDAFSWDMGDGGEFCRMDALNSVGARRITVKVNALIEKLNSKKIRIGFICQGGHLNKLASVYEVMRKKEETDVYILAVPPYENYNIGQPFDANDERYIKSQKEILENYGKNKNTTIINTVTKQGLIDLEPFQFDYVFYYRPYEILLPPNVRCQTVNRFAKTCYIPYCVTPQEQFIGFTLSNFFFFNNLNFFFTDCKEFAKEARKAYKTQTENSDQQFVFLGSPEMEDFRKAFESEFEFNLNKKRNSILWAPRWTYAPIMGGSHFIEYKDEFVAIRNKYKDLIMNLRPHPLLFPTMVKEKRMTEEEVVLYKKSLHENNIYLDEHETLQSIFSKSDIMIVDMSSIIPIYFMTGNPIIFCHSDYEWYGNSKIMEPAIYIAHNWEEVEKYLEMLLAGEDPLKDERRRIIKEMHKMHNGAAERIVQAIIDDYNNSN